MKTLILGLALALVATLVKADAGLPVPEPSILGLMGIAIGAILFIRK